MQWNKIIRGKSVDFFKDELTPSLTFPDVWLWYWEDEAGNRLCPQYSSVEPTDVEIESTY